MAYDTLSIENNQLSKIVPDNQTTTWKSCCIEVDKNAFKYIIQVSILAVIISTSCVMLVVDHDCGQQRNWSGILTLCLGILVPSPTLHS